MKRLLLIPLGVALIFLFSISLPDHLKAKQEENAVISSTTPYQGDTVLVTFYTKSLELTQGTFNKAPVSFFPYKSSFRAAFGIPATLAPGTYPLILNFKDGSVFEKQITVRKKAFVVIDLGVPEKLHLTPQKLVTSLQSQNQNVASVISEPTAAIYFDAPFRFPLSVGKIGSTFGEIRKTGDEVIRHLGTDFTAPIGTRIYAINNGVVRKVYVDPLYGKMIILDHGEGIYSLYLHMNSFSVKDNQKIKKGMVLGTVGQTGYATGPHLHLSVKVNNVSVDPLQFIAVFK